MATNPYVGFTWEDRNTEYMNRRKLVDTTTQEETQVFVYRDEGQTTGGNYTEGTPFAAYYMNGMESRINAAFAEVVNRIVAAAVSNIADAYDSTATYSEGDYCAYDGVLYKCNTDITVAEVFTPAHWDATKVMDEGGGAALPQAEGSGF